MEYSGTNSRTILPKLDRPFSSDEESTTFHSTISDSNDQLSLEKYIKSTAPSITSSKSPPRIFARQTHSVPPQHNGVNSIGLLSSNGFPIMSHSLSLQNNRPLSPISSCGGSGMDDEDETLYALNSHNDDNNDEEMMSYSQPRDENECLMSEEEADDICDFSYRDDYSTATNSEIAPISSRFDLLMTQRRNSNGQPCPPIPPKPVKLTNIHIETPMPSVSLSVPINNKCQNIDSIAQIPVIVLQNVLTRLSYKELSDFRRVHPHWDEICGQLLNTGYYTLIHAADRLLTDYQRKVYKDKTLSKPIQILTNLQVHVLNPVDVLRAAMDEGVLCFPYGLILDKAFELLEKIQTIVFLGQELDTNLNWEQLAELSRRAQIHYRRFVEPEAEKRMSEVCKVSAVQRLQRLDSFMVEASVTKLEKLAEKAKEDLRWEMEQLKIQNQQLKKDNRELKSTCLKLDSRVEVLERKFKTMGRLLQ